MKYFGTITDPKDLVNKEYIDNIADTKANIDGAYENMTVGNAEQLVSTVMVNDQEPYIFRTSGGSADIGDREYDTIVGGSLPWNQLWPTPDFSQGSAIFINGGTGTVTDGEITITGNDVGTRVTLSAADAYRPSVENILNHVIFISVDVESNASNLQIKPTGYGGDGYKQINQPELSTKATRTLFWKRTSIGAQHIIQWTLDFIPTDGVVTVCKISNYCIFDLTAMFGVDIANYVYALEQATEGAGGAWFRHYFSTPYYAYNPGNSLLHVQGLQSHDMTGFNQWDEEWESGGISSSGVPVTDQYRIRSKNFTPVLPNTDYYCYSKNGSIVYLYYYDISKQYISGATFTNRIRTTPQNCYFIKIRIGGGAEAPVTSYDNDVCINLSRSGYRDGEYEPYKLNSYPLDSSVVLRGIPKKDANGKLYYDGDRYLPNGTVDRRYGIVDLGTLNWRNTNTSVEGKSRMRSDEVLATAKSTSTSSNKANIICSKYITITDLETAGTSPYSLTMGIAIDTLGYIRIYDPAYDDGASGTPAAFKTAVSGVYLVYELDTPTTETAEPFQSPQIVDNWGTEEYVVTPQGDVAVPVGHDTNYANNLRAKLEMAPESPSGDGDYIVRQTSGQNAYVPLVFPVDELPVVPSEDGSYTLQVTISGGTATYSWVSA